ncbi:MAG: DUF4833 domain-containing protein [Spirochaetes bacterium]|nr:DUF4833 domain-containing protein [Spirochaetota bacterium]
MVERLAEKSGNALRTETNLFFVRRNTNRNEVHYALRYDQTTGEPLAHEPVHVFWRMFEIGEAATEPITIFEQMAFGIESQKYDGAAILLRLKALPEREIHITRSVDSRDYTPKIMLHGHEAELQWFYVFAEPGFLMPKVKYVEIHSLQGGEPVVERIMK